MSIYQKLNHRILAIMLFVSCIPITTWAYMENATHFIDDRISAIQERSQITQIEPSFWKQAQDNNLSYFNFMEKTCYARFWVTRCLDAFRLNMKSMAKFIKTEELTYQQLFQEQQRKIRYYKISHTDINIDLDTQLAEQLKQGTIIKQQEQEQIAKIKTYQQKQKDYDIQQQKIINNPIIIPTKNRLKPLPVLNQ
jgi:hypothetical protein